MPNAIEIDDAIVLLLGADVPGSKPGEIQGITRLEKLIFLLERETESQKWLQEDAQFEPYNFGPFSQKVYRAVDMLSAAGLIEDSSSPSADDSDTWEQREGIGFDSGAPDSARSDAYRTRDFKLTERGWRYYKVLAPEIPKSGMKELSELKKRFAYVPLRQLIRYVYVRYEDYTTRSLIRDDILGDK